MLPHSMEADGKGGRPAGAEEAGRRAPGVVARATLTALLLGAAVALSSLGIAALFLALDPGAGGPKALLRLLPLAGAAVAAAGLVGYAAGVDLGREMRSALSAVRMGLLVRRPREELACDSSVEELDALVEAVRRLEGRFFEDMTLYADALAEVEMMDGQRTDLLTAVATQLYAPIDRVVSLSRRLLDGEDGPIDDAKAEDARIVHGAALRLREMVTEILDLSSLVSRDVKLEMERVDIVGIAREVVETARGQVGERRLAIRLEAPDRPVIIDGHRRRLWQIATNLVGNAVKFTEKGSITVTVAVPEGGGARLEVLDTGIGIAARDQASIFDTFRQIGGRVVAGRGTGLGLAITRRLVELHRGRIGVSSVIDRGTRFSVTFPPPEGEP